MRDRLSSNHKSWSLVWVVIGTCLGLLGGFAYAERFYNANTRPDNLVGKISEAPKFAKKITSTIEDVFSPKEYEHERKKWVKGDKKRGRQGVV